MSYTVRAQWMHDEESGYETLGDAVEDAADILRRHPDAFVTVAGEGVTVVLNKREAEVTA